MTRVHTIAATNAISGRGIGLNLEWYVLLRAKPSPVVEGDLVNHLRAMTTAKMLFS